MSKFKEGILNVVKEIPVGKVVSYGQVALYVGMPRAARQVGWILSGLGDNTDIPWWRVVNNSGRISIKGSKYSPLEQKTLLESEGVRVNDDLTFDIEEYRFKPNEKYVKKLQLDPHYLDILADRIYFK